MKRVYIVCVNFILVIILLSVYFFSRSQEDYLLYLENKDKCIYVNAVIEEIKNVEREGREKLEKTSIISYAKGDLYINTMIKVDRRDSVGKSITIAVLPNESFLYNLKCKGS